MPVIDHNELRRIGRRVFIAGGSSEEEAAIIADHLVEANLKGHDSHGVGMIPSYLRNLHGGKAAANQSGQIVSDSGAFIVYDGARGYGQIVAREATKLGIARAKENGVAVVALRNAHHIGRVGTHGESAGDVRDVISAAAEMERVRGAQASALGPMRVGWDLAGNQDASGEVRLDFRECLLQFGERDLTAKVGKPKGILGFIA